MKKNWKLNWKSGLRNALRLALSVGLIGCFALSLYFANQLGYDGATTRNDKPYEAHYAAVLVGTEKTFLREIQKGMDEVATELHLAVEYFIVDSTEEANEKIRMLMLAGVDGLMTQGINEPDFKATLEEVISDQIPLVLFYTDLSTVDREAFVGINPFEMGVKGANLWAQSGIQVGDIIYLSQSFSDIEEDAGTKLQLMGFRDGLSNRGITNQVVDIQTRPEILSAEETLSQLFLTQTNAFSSIVCTTLNDTLGVAQVVVDLNKVGRVKIIGSGLNAQLADYINKGVISGTIFQNPRAIGNKAVELLHTIHLADLKGASSAIEHVDMPLEVITKDNLSDYLRFIEGGI